MVTAVFARFAAGLTYDHLPEEARVAVRRVLLDWLGNVYAGAATRTGQIVRDVVTEGGGTPEASLIGFGARSSAFGAALVNGASSHIVEFDDIYREAIYHPGAPTIAAAFAVAEKLGADGRRLAAAIAAGYDVGNRIGAAIQPAHYRFWHTTGTVGTFGAAAAAGNLLGLSEEEMTWAFGSAGSQAAGLWQFLEDGQTMTKPLHAGKAAANGVLAALLAKKGFGGATRILEGEKGFAAATSSNWSFERVLSTLGSHFTVVDTTFKAYASCGHTHPSIDATKAIVAAHGVRAGDVERVKIRTYDQAYTVCQNPSPQTTYQAKFSIPYTVAITLRFGRVGTAEFAQERIRDEETAELMRRIEVEPDPELTALVPGRRPAVVQIILKDGRSFTQREDFRKGDPENPPSQQELEDKFRDLASATLSPEEAAFTIEAVSSLESVEDVSMLLRR